VWEVIHAIGGGVTSMLLKVDVYGEPLMLPVMSEKYPESLMRGNMVWVRGILRCGRTPSGKYLHYLEPKWLERLQSGSASRVSPPV
jgi:hypothetical protein